MTSVELLTTFYIGNEYYGIEVMKVQEVAQSSTIVSVPLAPKFVKGLINLRGQIATALGLRELFGEAPNESKDQMSVVCRVDGNLISLIVDQIGDVVEIDKKDYEAVPDTVPANLRKFVKGVYKMNGALLSVLDLERVASELSPALEPIENRLQTEVNH